MLTNLESTDKLPSMSVFSQFATATKLMQPHFEQALEKLIPHVTCIVSDGFLSWTLESANKFGIHRLFYFGMSGYSTAISQQVALNRLLSGPEPDDDLITVTRLNLHSIRFSRRDIIETVGSDIKGFGIIPSEFLVGGEELRFEKRVGERGIIVREWVNQLEILKHESVKGFVSHCGSNSVLESICSEVPILAWPIMAEQPLNARMVVEEIKIDLQVETCNGSERDAEERETGETERKRERPEGER
ncbi:hypothetical protein LXL04_014059 [Taraxacum kok-saghyz]